MLSCQQSNSHPQPLQHLHITPLGNGHRGQIYPLKLPHHLVNVPTVKCLLSQKDRLLFRDKGDKPQHFSSKYFFLYRLPNDFASPAFLIKVTAGNDVIKHAAEYVFCLFDNFRYPAYRFRRTRDLGYSVLLCKMNLRTQYSRKLH